ncbi:ATP-binding protein [Virgibacillus halophilus]|uniref:histidine kinase n=1 Tax=Tigheibacillus halophilus TaxID=361280 RepID=A0ABU5C5U2_9BACI|nr:ATP-binding protein [Virgibacillus halophilus]
MKASILAIIISAILGILVARTITKPIKEMRRQAQTIARGDFSQNVNIYGTDEIGQLAVSFNDMNDRLRHTYAIVEEEQRKLTSVLENMSDGVIATDVNGIVTLMNEPAAILLGKSPEDCKGRYLLDIVEMNKEQLHVATMADHGSVIFDFGDEENDLLIRAKFSTVLDEDEDTAAYILVLSDVTEQEKIEAERREFVSNVSHELRTPLTTMRSYIEALTDGAWQDESIAPRFLQVTQNETERMIRMVNDLLQLSKMDSRDYKLEQERVDFIAFFHEVIDRFEMNVPEHISFSRELPPQRMFVWIDRDKMIQVLDNVISNAIKYSPDGGKIYFRAIKQKHRILASVEDEGMGIPYDKVDKVFERFYRADKARSRKLGGTGLGLAISKELVEAHQGDIWAKSREGKGTTVFIALPLMGRDRGAGK